MLANTVSCKKRSRRLSSRGLPEFVSLRAGLQACWFRHGPRVYLLSVCVCVDVRVGESLFFFRAECAPVTLLLSAELPPALSSLY
jgi:hypothetical protein